MLERQRLARKTKSDCCSLPKGRLKLFHLLKLERILVIDLANNVRRTQLQDLEIYGEISYRKNLKEIKKLF